MTTIYKYPVSPECEIEMPRGAKILTVQTQRGEPQLWALVDPDAPKERRRNVAFGTGHDIAYPEHLTYIGTVQMPGVSLIFHVFEDMAVYI